MVIQVSVPRMKAAVRSGLAARPAGASWLQCLGVAVLWVVVAYVFYLVTPSVPVAIGKALSFIAQARMVCGCRASTMSMLS